MQPLHHHTSLLNGKQGEICVQKSPAATISQLARVVKKIFNAKNTIKVIGIRHGEKNHETLISSEEMIRAVEENNYFRIKADNRDLNYSKFFTKGNKKFKKYVEYNSENTKRLTDIELAKMLKKIRIN